jgi:Haem-degrading
MSGLISRAARTDSPFVGERSSPGIPFGKTILPFAWLFPETPRAAFRRAPHATVPAITKLGATQLKTQQPAYIERQLAAFAQGFRQNDINEQMRTIAAQLTPDEMRRRTRQGDARCSDRASSRALAVLRSNRGLRCVTLSPVALRSERSFSLGRAPRRNCWKRRRWAWQREAEAERNHWRGVVAVVDDGGWVILLESIDHAALTAGVELAPGKARAAALYKKPSQELEEAINHGRYAAITPRGFIEMQGALPVVPR